MKLELTQNELNLILECLIHLPYIKSADLLHKIKDQIKNNLDNE